MQPDLEPPATANIDYAPPPTKKTAKTKPGPQRHVPTARDAAIAIGILGALILGGLLVAHKIGTSAQIINIIGASVALIASGIDLGLKAVKSRSKNRTLPWSVTLTSGAVFIASIYLLVGAIFA